MSNKMYKSREKARQMRLGCASERRNLSPSVHTFDDELILTSAERLDMSLRPEPFGSERLDMSLRPELEPRGSSTCLSRSTKDAENSLRNYLTTFRARITVWEKYRKEVTQSFDNYYGDIPPL